MGYLSMGFPSSLFETLVDQHYNSTYCKKTVFMLLNGGKTKAIGLHAWSQMWTVLDKKTSNIKVIVLKVIISQARSREIIG